MYIGGSSPYMLISHRGEGINLAIILSFSYIETIVSSYGWECERVVEMHTQHYSFNLCLGKKK
jgi:hypothetical protein